MPALNARGWFYIAVNGSKWFVRIMIGSFDCDLYFLSCISLQGEIAMFDPTCVCICFRQSLIHSFSQSVSAFPTPSKEVRSFIQASPAGGLVIIQSNGRMINNYLLAVEFASSS